MKHICDQPKHWSQNSHWWRSWLMCTVQYIGHGPRGRATPSPRLKLLVVFFWFPVILKREVRCGSQRSYDWAVLWDTAGALGAPRTVPHFDEGDDTLTPCNDFLGDVFVQEYEQHTGGAVFKHSAVRVRIHCTGGSGCGTPGRPDRHGYFLFGSQKMKSDAVVGFDERSSRFTHFSAVMPSKRDLDAVCQSVRFGLEVEIVGIDLLVVVWRSVFFIVGHNYFRDIPCAASCTSDRIFEFVCTRAWNNSRGNGIIPSLPEWLTLCSRFFFASIILGL